MDVWSIAWGSICHVYMCMLRYVKVTGCNGMCILLYVKLIGCNGFPWIYAQLGGQPAMDICAFCYMWNLLGVTVLLGYMFNWGGCLSALGICAFHYMLKLCHVMVFNWSMLDCGLPNGVMVFQRSMLNWPGGSIGGSITYKRLNNNNIQINLHILFNIFVIMSCLIIVFTVQYCCWCDSSVVAHAQ